VISEGSCDTEDWSNDAENTGINDTLPYRKQLFYIAIIFYNSAVFTMFLRKYLINPALVNFFQKRFLEGDHHN